MLHQESLQRGNLSTAQPNALVLHDEPSLESSEAYKQACKSLYSSTRGKYTKGEALAGLFVVSAFLFLGEHAWQHFLAIATEWVWNILNTGVDPAETILWCSDMQQFVIKTTFWFDILTSTIRLEPPRFLIFCRKLWSLERGAYIKGGTGTTGTNPRAAAAAAGSSA